MSEFKLKEKISPEVKTIGTCVLYFKGCIVDYYLCQSSYRVTILLLNRIIIIS